MKRILITGESGTIPMAMQRIASRFDCEVVNTQLEDNFLTNYKSHQSFKVRKFELDFLDRRLLEHLFNTKFVDEKRCYEGKLCEHVDLIIHSGAYVGTDFCSSDPSMAIRTNVEGTQNIVDICNKYSIPLIYLSTTAILDPKDYSKSKPMSELTEINPQTLYGITKYAGELIVKNTCKTKRIIVRPVFGFGDYPDDLHSALTKIMYVMYRNIIGNETNLTVLLDKNIHKSYTRVENIAACILKFANALNAGVFSDCSIFNIGENFKKSRDWDSLFSLIGYEFVIRNLCSEREARTIFNKHITFVPEKDYLHYHNLDNSKLQMIGYDFDTQPDYISLESGIFSTLDSVIKNVEQEPYWI